MYLSLLLFLSLLFSFSPDYSYVSAAFFLSRSLSLLSVGERNVYTHKFFTFTLVYSKLHLLCVDRRACLSALSFAKLRISSALHILTFLPTHASSNAFLDCNRSCVVRHVVVSCAFAYYCFFFYSLLFFSLFRSGSGFNGRFTVREGTFQNEASTR